MQSLGHACIFCTSNPRGQTNCFASYIVLGNSLSIGSIFSKVLVIHQIPCLIHHMLPSIEATPVWCQASSTHPHILGTTTCDGPLSSAGTLAYLFHSHNLPAHR